MTTASGSFHYLTLSAIFSFSSLSGFYGSARNFFLSPRWVAQSRPGCRNLGAFDWIASVDEIPMRMAKIEWLPMGSYYHAEPRGALFDLAKKLFCWGGLVFLSPDLKALKMQEDGNVWPFLSV
jgi:hypothetical protein